MILLVRHAKAEAEHRLGDWARGLTAEGRTSFRRHARSLTSRLRLQGIATSPYVRAVQTAEILAEACDVAEVSVRFELVPAKGVGQQIAKLAAELGTGWALVGHNPSLEEAARLMLKLRALSFSLKKGSLLALRRLNADNKFTFEWLATPGKGIRHDPEE
jgi:phosphohistidine phosphatase